MGVGVVREGAAQHYVSYSSVQQNDQIIAVVEAGRLSVGLEKPAVVAVRGKSVAVPVKVGRGKGLAGPVKVELIAPQHLHGVTAEPVVVPADQSAGVLTLHFARRAGAVQHAAHRAGDADGRRPRRRGGEAGGRVREVKCMRLQKSGRALESIS